VSWLVTVLDDVPDREQGLMIPRHRSDKHLNSLSILIEAVSEKNAKVAQPLDAVEPIKSPESNNSTNKLCKNHNQAFSVVDDEGIAAFHAIRRFEGFLSGRKHQVASSDLEHKASGPLLERWFIRHAINLFVALAPKKYWYDGSEPTIPSRDVLEAVAGLGQLVYPRGLYNWAGRHGEQRVVGDQVGFLPLYDSNGRYAGAVFEFQALSFLIWLYDSHSDPVALPWPFIRDFYHHFGGFFEVGRLRAKFHVQW
jgi:hypothetical protein